MASRHSQVARINPIHLDSAGRLITGSPLTLGDYKTTNDNNPLYIDYVGTGTFTHSQAEAHVNMSVTSGQYCISQTRLKHPYFSGKPQDVETTNQDFTLQANVTKMFGYYDSDTTGTYNTGYDGITIENDGTTYYCKVYKNGSVIYSQARSAWDDKLDGTGASGVNMDGTNFSIWGITFLWLGGSSVNWYIIANNEKIVFNTYNHAYHTAGVMMRTPKKPVRYEIRSSTGTGNIKPICTGVMSIGQDSLVGKQFAVNNNTAIAFTATDTDYALIAIRLKSGWLDNSILTEATKLLSTTNDSFISRIVINPTIAGTPTWNSVTGSACEYFVGDGNTITATGGSTIDVTPAPNNTQVLQDSRTVYRLGSSINGTADTVVLVARSLSAGLSMYASMKWLEV